MEVESLHDSGIFEDKNEEDIHAIIAAFKNFNLSLRNEIIRAILNSSGMIGMPAIETTDQ